MSLTKDEKYCIINIIEPIRKSRIEDDMTKYLSRYACVYFSTWKRKSIYEFVREYMKGKE